jgi:hypothetical protein
VSAAALAKRLDKLALVPEQGVIAAAAVVEKIAEQEAARVGGFVTLGRKRRRVRLTTVARIKRIPGGAQITLWGKPTGGWVWATDGTDAHAIPKRRPTKRKPRPMHGDGYEHPISNKQIQHPGSAGRGAWTRVRQRADREVPQIIADLVHEAVR